MKSNDVTSFDHTPRDKFTLPSFAKINLTLRVLGKRTDGYHELNTIFQTVSLRDEIAFELLDAERFELRCDAPDVPVDETNLITRAAKLLISIADCGVRSADCQSAPRADAFGFQIRNPQGARITLTKEIPLGGGLGGGSSNAAVALLGLARLWNIKMSVEELAKLSAQLGADVPFFFTGGTALGTGCGTEIRALEDVPPRELLIVTPDVHVSTADAYQRLNAHALTKDVRQITLTVSGADAAPDCLNHKEARNDFEAVIFSAFPEIEAAHDALIKYGARRAMLSGSGASVFGVFDNQILRDEACKVLQREVRKREMRWRVLKCATVSRKDYTSAFGDFFSP